MPSLKDLAEWFLYQNNRGTKIYGASDHLVSSAFYLNDPDGNGVEVYADTDDATWKYESYGILMDTLPLDIRKLVSGVEVPNTLKNEVRFVMFI
jgi:catechol 2,3-dioxygenase